MALTYREKKKKMICKIFQNNSPKNDLREISSIINDYLRSILASNEIIISIRSADETFDTIVTISVRYPRVEYRAISQ